MPPRRQIYNVILKDLSRDHEYYWTRKIRKEISEYLTSWFKEICGYSKEFKGATVNCWWSSNALLLEDDELLVYFLPEHRRSVIRKVTGRTPLDLGGATSNSDEGMISEVYISKSAGDMRIGRLLAVNAFHELMHNKLDTHPHKSVINNVHALGGAAKERFKSGDIPTGGNKRKMGKHLGLEIKQYTGHMFSNTVGSVP